MDVILLILLNFVVSFVMIGTIRYLFSHKITPKEFYIGLGVSIGLSLLVIAISMFPSYSTKIVHGHVTDKYQDEVPCSHSYQVCRTVGKEQRCETKYEHWNDWDWVVNTTVGKITINRVDSRGSLMPKRFQTVKIGENASRMVSYVDYIKNSESIYDTLSTLDETHPLYKSRVPYPNVTDYYRVHLVKTTDKNYQPYANKLNTTLRDVLRDNPKRLNLVVILTDKSQSYAEYIKRLWNNGRFNDGVVVIGLDDYNIQWVQVFGWSKSKAYDAHMKMDIMGLKTLSSSNLQDFGQIVKTNMKYYEPTDMEDFSYLSYDLKLTWGVILAMVLLQGVGNAVVAYLAYNENL